jgi:hypothetical protein
VVYKYTEIYNGSFFLTRLLRVVLAGIGLASILVILSILGLGLGRIAVLIRQLVPDRFEESFVLAVTGRLGGR